nr:MAG TPA: hypothetical protein [Caudoviricetes sp.]
MSVGKIQMCVCGGIYIHAHARTFVFSPRTYIQMLPYFCHVHLFVYDVHFINNLFINCLQKIYIIFFIKAVFFYRNITIKYKKGVL